MCNIKNKYIIIKICMILYIFLFRDFIQSRSAGVERNSPVATQGDASEAEGHGDGSSACFVGEL